MSSFSSPLPKICITGATGALGSRILHHLLHTLSYPPSSLIISTSNPSQASTTLPPSISIRHGDFLKPSTLPSAFASAQCLILISHPAMAHQARVTAHQNAIDAAVRAGVKYIVYTSLAFAGDSEALVMKAHLDTEEYLKKTCARIEGLRYTIVREGIYSESFPLYLGTSDAKQMATEEGERSVVVPKGGLGGGIAWVSRDELGEGTARIVLDGSGEFTDKTVLLSGSRAIGLDELAGIISSILGWHGKEALRIQQVGREEYVDVQTLRKTGRADDEETRQFMEAWVSTYPAIERGELATVDPLLEKLLGRPLTTMEESLMQQLKDVHSAEGVLS